MALFVQDELVPNPEQTLSQFQSFVKIYKNYFETGSSQLILQDVIKISDKDATLYVNQREFAVLAGDGTCPFTKIGSDMATTCHIVVLYHGSTRVVALGHFDGSCTEQGVDDMVGKVAQESVSRCGSVKDGVIDLDLHIVGGFSDEKLHSEELSVKLLKEFYYYKAKRGTPTARMHLKTFCASALNNTTVEKVRKSQRTVSVNSPGIFGIVCDATTGLLAPAVFDSDTRLPASDLRGARSLNGVHYMPNIFRMEDNCFVMEPFSYRPFPDVDFWIQQPDHVILKYMSTSPDVEPDNFCDHIRETLAFIRDHPDPPRSVFKNGALVFRPHFSDNRLTWHRA